MGKTSSDPINNGKIKVLICLMVLFIVIALYQIYSLASDNWNCHAALKSYQEYYANKENKTSFSGKTGIKAGAVVIRDKKVQGPEDTTLQEKTEKNIEHQ